MSLYSGDDQPAAEAIAELCYTNPFLPRRIELEKRALGAAHKDVQRAWNLGDHGENPNTEVLAERASALLEQGRARMRDGRPLRPEDRALYEDLVRYHLYYRLEELLHTLAQKSAAGGLTKRRVSSFKLFSDEAARLCDVPGEALRVTKQLPHLFAILFQLRRAFYLVYENILGASDAAVTLRASVWESIFTHDMRRYQRSLYSGMDEITTLITGPSGTGKELVARAIGMSRYIPFDADSLRFAEESSAAFHALNISALAPTVLESELFGHKKGAFTDAVEDRQGWLETCADHGTVFLDEIGELDPAIQVKLLRVLQTRTFSRVGESAERNFAGKLIAATNRDLAAEMQQGSFREDFYYRLCSDTIRTPSLHAQLSERPQDLRVFVGKTVRRFVDEIEQEAAIDEVCEFIEQHLAGYRWPGNVRELEQSVRSIIVRGSYSPVRSSEPHEPLERIAQRFADAELDADGMLDAYITLVYHRTGSYVEAARRLGLDRRTVKARLDAGLLEELKG
ncbi:MAG: sigma 54-interacting transcriptional regulator [Myxococcales bacterium]|nr:sigma 54-interacting transcriptional regulator [Myxococcales bacterium]